MQEVDRLIIDDVIIDKNILEVKYRPLGKTLDAITNSLEWFVEYSEDISMVPKSVAVIPFITNVLPFIWLQDAVLEVDELDESFYNSIIWFKRGYIDMYPMMRFKGAIKYNKLVNNNYEPSSKTITLFSGGVDSTSTLVSHIKEDMTLLSVWGADIYFNDEKGWNIVKTNTENICKQNNLTPAFVKSCFKRNLKYKYLNELVKPCHDNYWHGLQHGIGLIGHFAPLVYKHKYRTCYIPASPCVKDECYESCASYPTIDEKIKLCGCSVIHDGYELNRQERIDNICNYSKSNNIYFDIRVCFETIGGENCCHCEKCLRTMFGILVQGSDPRNYGFKYDDSEINDLIAKVKTLNLPSILVECWQDIRATYIKKKNELSQFENILSWLVDYDFRKAYYQRLSTQKK